MAVQWPDFLYAGSLHYSPISNRCIPGNLDYRGSSLIAVAGILDALLLGLTLYKGIRSTLSIRTESGPSIVCVKVQLSPIWA